MSRVKNIIRGGVGGGSALAATGNPWAVVGGVLTGGALGALEDEPELSPLERRFNQLSVGNLQNQFDIGQMNVREAKRLEVERRRAKRQKANIGNMLGKYFERL